MGPGWHGISWRGVARYSEAIIQTKLSRANVVSNACLRPFEFGALTMTSLCLQPPHPFSSHLVSLLGFSLSGSTYVKLIFTDVCECACLYLFNIIPSVSVSLSLSLCLCLSLSFCRHPFPFIGLLNGIFTSRNLRSFWLAHRQQSHFYLGH